MELFLKLFILFAYFSLSISYVIESDESDESLVWPEEYHYTGEKLLLKTDIVETFEVWYNAEENRSRIDIDGGIVKRYYQADPKDNESVNVYQINPITDDEVTNEMLCRSVFDESTIKHLPEVNDFTYQGNRSFDGKVVQVWKSVEEDDDRIERTLYVYRDEGIYIPVRYEKIEYNLWTEGISKHEITNFYKFNSTVDSQDLDVKKAEACKDLGKLGENFKTDLEFLHPGFSSDVDRAFHGYKKHFNKQHQEKEHEMRKAIFEDNWKRVVAHNKKNLSYKLEVNKFADLTDVELAHLSATRLSHAKTLGTHPYPYSEEDLRLMEEQLPLFYDMRIEGIISPVKNQGSSCGSCWTFSTVAAVEAALSKSNGGRNIDLSEQSILDCAWSGNYGCSGGFVDRAFKYILTHGIPTEMKYGPYLQQNGYCKLENITDVHKIKGFAKVPSLSETSLKATLYNFGPVSVTITATKNMELYSSGVFYDIECKKDAKMGNHAVTVVGYGVRDGVTYWIVKNSWGEDWGQDGYILMFSTNDNCNLMSEAYYPIV